MNCWKCMNPAVVHLTDLVTESEGRKRCVEIHLCLTHAVESGFLAHLPIKGVATPVAKKQAEPVESGGGGPTVVKPTSPATPAALVPLGPAGGLNVVRKDRGAEAPACPVCGLTYSQFKHAGLMGCPYDYAFFEARLLPVIKRAQEGATQHAGKVPTQIRQAEPARAVLLARLRRELSQALEGELYERAAEIRDQVKELVG